MDHSPSPVFVKPRFSSGSRRRTDQRAARHPAAPIVVIRCGAAAGMTAAALTAAHCRLVYRRQCIDDLRYGPRCRALMQCLGGATCGVLGPPFRNGAFGWRAWGGALFRGRPPPFGKVHLGGRTRTCDTLVRAIPFPGSCAGQGHALWRRVTVAIDVVSARGVMVAAGRARVSGCAGALVPAAACQAPRERGLRPRHDCICLAAFVLVIRLWSPDSGHLFRVIFFGASCRVIAPRTAITSGGQGMVFNAGACLHDDVGWICSRR